MNYNIKRVVRQNTAGAGVSGAVETHCMPTAQLHVPQISQIHTPVAIVSNNANVKRVVRSTATCNVVNTAAEAQPGTSASVYVQQVPQQQQHQVSEIAAVLNNGQASSNVTGASSAAINEESVSLQSEISDIMRSLGDCDQPHPDSVKLVEHILQQQMRGIYNEALALALKRKKTLSPTQVDFEFLLRRHPVRVARMRKHLKDMRILKKFLSIRTGRPQDFMEDLETPDSDDDLNIEVIEKYDEERTRRLFRADRISQILTGQQYHEFNEARRTSFYCRHGEKIKNKFHKFLHIPTNVRISTTVLNILAYFAHETIAVIVDNAILTRLNSANRITEPYSRVTTTGASTAMMHLCPEVTQGRGQEVVRPITVQEIHEGMRRFRQMTTKKMGFYRNSCDVDFRRSFLAI